MLARLAGLTLVTQLWWLMAYSVGGAFGLPILQVTETVRETSGTTSAVEVFRGLGYWFFYGGDNQGPWLDGVAPQFTQSLVLLAASFAAPLACVALGWWSRFRERAFFVGLVVGGLLLSTVAFGTTDRSFVGTIFESMSRHSGLVLSLRNTQRAAALTALGLAGLAAAGIAALRARHLDWGRVGAAVVVAGALLTFSSPWGSALIASRYDRPEAIPQAWVDTARYLDRVGGRAMLAPGEDFASYRWGHTLDPVLAGLTRTDLVWRELLPMGGESGADLVGAFDQGIQEGSFDPRAIVPVARALGVSHIVVANDLELERYRLPRPEAVMAAFLDPASGLTLEKAFGPGYQNLNPGAPIVDEIIQRTRTHDAATPLPQVAVFSVPGVSDAPVTATPKGAGDGGARRRRGRARRRGVGPARPRARAAAHGRRARHLAGRPPRRARRRRPPHRHRHEPQAGPALHVAARELRRDRGRRRHARVGPRHRRARLRLHPGHRSVAVDRRAARRGVHRRLGVRQRHQPPPRGPSHQRVRRRPAHVVALRLPALSSAEVRQHRHAVDRPGPEGVGRPRRRGPADQPARARSRSPRSTSSSTAPA